MYMHCCGSKLSAFFCQRYDYYRLNGLTAFFFGSVNMQFSIVECLAFMCHMATYSFGLMKSPTDTETFSNIVQPMNIFGYCCCYLKTDFHSDGNFSPNLSIEPLCFQIQYCLDDRHLFQVPNGRIQSRSN